MTVPIPPSPKASPEDFDWAKIFEGADWFHFTGITPALNDTVAGICLEACKKAKELGLTVSCDSKKHRNQAVVQRPKPAR